MTKQFEDQSGKKPVSAGAPRKFPAPGHPAGNSARNGEALPGQKLASQIPIRQNTGSSEGSFPERLCIVTREAKPSHGLLRFVVSPDNQLVPDLKENLPGRGAWVSNSRSLLEAAVAKKLFARSFRQHLIVDAGICDQVESLMRRAILGKLSLARKAGLVTTGFNKVIEALRKKDIALVLHASEAANDGRKQIASAIHANEKNNFPHHAVSVHDGFCGGELDGALGNSNITHVAIEAAPLALSMLTDLAKFMKYQELDNGVATSEPDLKSETCSPPEKVPDLANGGG